MDAERPDTHADAERRHESDFGMCKFFVPMLCGGTQNRILVPLLCGGTQCQNALRS